MKKVALLLCITILFSCTTKNGIGNNTNKLIGTFWCSNIGYEGKGQRIVFKDSQIHMPWEKEDPDDAKIYFVLDYEVINGKKYYVYLKKDTVSLYESYYVFNDDMKTFEIYDVNDNVLAGTQCKYASDSTVIFEE